MTIRISLQNLEQLIEQFSYVKYGDDYEKQYWELISRYFPNSEQFWRYFVVPLTDRIENPILKPKDLIRFREDTKPELQKIASANYSIFKHLVYAHWHHQNQAPSKLENVYTHLGTVCDLAEGLIANWYLVWLECHGVKSKFLNRLSREEFLDLAGEWYDKHYPRLYEHYKLKGRFIPIKIPNVKDLIREYYGESQPIKEYLNFSQKLREFRNVVVHDIQLGRLVEADGTIFVPKLHKVLNYRTWESLQLIVGKSNIVDRDFIEINQQLQDSIIGLESILNKLWIKPIEDFKEEFFTRERNNLRKMYDIELIEEPSKSIGDNKLWETLLLAKTTSASGVYPKNDIADDEYRGGSVEFPIPPTDLPQE